MNHQEQPEEREDKKIQRYPEPDPISVAQEISAAFTGASLVLTLLSEGAPIRALPVARDLQARLARLQADYDPESTWLYGQAVSSRNLVPLSLISSEKAKYRLQLLEALIHVHFSVVEERGAAGIEGQDSIAVALVALCAVLRAEVHGAASPHETTHGIAAG